MPDWASKRQELCEQITLNVHNVYKLRDDSTFTDPLTNETETVGSLLAELASQLCQHPEPPFTITRLCEMAELSPAEQKQYQPPDHGTAYLRAALLLARVTSPAAVFDRFDEYMNQSIRGEIKLEPIEWAAIDLSGPTTFLSTQKRIKVDPGYNRDNADPEAEGKTARLPEEGLKEDEETFALGNEEKGECEEAGRKEEEHDEQSELDQEEMAEPEKTDQANESAASS